MTRVDKSRGCQRCQQSDVRALQGMARYRGITAGKCARTVTRTDLITVGTGTACEVIWLEQDSMIFYS